MKKRNGFTLIELLVTIALMLSILGIAVVSLINISNKKKEEAWQQVKGQIETAATEYFTANEYLFEGISDETADAYVAVGMLVKEDYLNKVTDPRSGKSVNYCTKIKVNKSGSKLTAEYSEDVEKVEKNNECKGTYTVNIVEPGAPSINYKLTKENGTKANKNTQTGWYNSDRDSLGTDGNLNACVVLENTNKSGKIIETTIGGNKTNINNCITYKNDSGKHSNVEFTAKNTSGKIAKIIVSDINVDSVLPVGTAAITDENGTNIGHDAAYDQIGVYLLSRNPKVKISASDSVPGSGIDKVTKQGFLGLELQSQNDNNKSYLFGVTESEYFGTNADKYTIVDKAGNSSEVDAYYVATTTPSCDDLAMSTSGTTGDDGQTFVSDIYVSFDMDDGKYFNPTFLNTTYNYNSGYVGVKKETYRLSGEGTYHVYGNIYNKYRLGGAYCDTWVTKDTIGPACPTLAYDVTTSNGSTGDGRDGLTAGSLDAICPFDASGNRICQKNIMVKIWADLSNTDIVSADWYTNDGPGNYIDDVASGNMAITSYWSTWSRGCPWGGLNGAAGCGSWPKMLRSSSKNNGWRQGLFVVKDAVGNASYCLTPIFKLTTSKKEGQTGANCYSGLSYEGTKGDNGWYKSNITVKKNDKTLCTITTEGTNSKCSYTVTKNNKTKTCYSGGKKLDKTAPKMNITSGPKKGSCSGKRAITTTWTATDNLSGIAVEKDYYGFNNTYNWQLSNKLVDRGCSNGTTSCTYTHTWGPYCKSYGTPGSGNNYKLKWYLKDKAGNVNYGMSGSYKW